MVIFSCSALADMPWHQKRDRFWNILSCQKRAAKNASTNGGDASRVGIEKGGKYELC